MGLAVLLAGSSVTPAFAAGPSPDGEYNAFMERLQDNHMEYDELGDLIKNYYAPIKSAYDMIDSMENDNYQAALESRMAASDLVEEAAQIKADARDGSAEEKTSAAAVAKIMRSNARALRSYADATERGFTSYDSQKRSIDRSVNGIIYNMEKLMNTYEQTMAMRQMAAKGVELAETARSLQQTMQAQGLAVDRDVMSAAASYSSSSQQLASLDQGLEQMKKTLCLFTGWGSGGNPEIGPVPSADVDSIAAIDVAADKEKAVGNNYNLISLRHGSGGNMSQLAAQLAKNTTVTANKLRDVEYSEDTVRSNIQTLYDTILEKKASYDSALTAYQSGQIAWNAAQIQRQNGSVSQIQYLQLELAYLQAEAGFRCADLALQQALQDYSWAVKGVEVSSADE